MTTTTIRLPEDLKARIARAAKHAGPTSHNFILEALAEKAAVAEQRTGNLIIFVVDTSGSMGAERRIATAKSANEPSIQSRITTRPELAEIVTA